MGLIQEGTTAPDFNVTDEEGKDTRLADYRGQKIVLFFYPKADTPG
jgi:peroxiredoxin Q/BCP